jgi:hypothetical protein
MKNLLFTLLGLALVACSAPASQPSAVANVEETATLPTVESEAAAELVMTDDAAIFSINVQDFAYPAESAAVLNKIITLHESYNMPVDIYLTDVMTKIYAEQYPALLERIKSSPVVAVSYHYRAPRPYANQYDWLGLENMSEQQLYETIMRYETHWVDPVTGQTTDASGGYQYVADLIGYPPYAASSLSESKTIDDALMRVFTDLGAQMTVVHGRANNIGNQKKGLYVRPEHYDYMLFQHVGEDPAQAYEAALNEARNSQGGNAPYFVGVKMHDNDFFAAKSAWLTVYIDGGKRAPWNPELKAVPLSQVEQDAVWAMYEQTVAYVASQQGRITVVNLPMVLGLIK